MLNALTKHPLLALLLAAEKKYTSGAAMESDIRPRRCEQVRSVIEVTPHMA